MPSRICQRCQAAVIGLTCLCLVSPHADAHTHEAYGPVQTVPFIPGLPLTATIWVVVAAAPEFPPTWRHRSSLWPPPHPMVLSYTPNWWALI